ncbi:PLP-dependent aminotransferase family protein [Vreelandella titanicae]|nr:MULTISPECIES: PLP-dependent aminotransferase family protein [Halomonas]NAO94489.1 aminotransferase class I/II-fold pyridoxal phosphate-dependent enzyme [Halomonas sp. MG34]QGQ71569.1 PLP-dependent aminotransferase family protein [Halomonas sp. PA16-9]MCE7518536.1 PLP-dependent aminotransferase family protein [Halomonas titanicae]NVE88550.1 PLP-dependent aminotransferase family protein [Halomonas titanicae]PKH61886.1 PLP-dependent aminotransferase family protein [Halomonas sp. Choline-3u-9]
MKQKPPRAQQVANTVIERIEQGQLTAGTRLPSIRNATLSFGVSKNTIIDAYDRLVATGYISPRRGSGFYVEATRPAHPAIKPEHFTEAVDLVSLLREQLNQHYEVRAGDGRLPASWMESSDIRRYFKRSNQDHDARDEFEYGNPQGLIGLREDIARTLNDRAISVHPNQILMTFGANHALDLIVRHFVEPGEVVLVESPGYYPMFGKLRLQRAKTIGITRGPQGLDLDMLEQSIREYRPRLLFVQPMAHNPTGTSMSLQNMHALLRIAEQHDLTIIEDDPFGDILPRSTPHLASLDGLNRVIYVGTFSKTLSASMRCGYIAANQTLVRSLIDIKMLTVVTSSSIIERMIHEMIIHGRYRRQMTRLRERVAKASAAAISSLKNIGFKQIQPPTGSYYIWCPLPKSVDGLELAKKASAQGIFLAPGNLFTLGNDESGSALRINIALANHPLLLNFLKEEALS